MKHVTRSGPTLICPALALSLVLTFSISNAWIQPASADPVVAGNYSVDTASLGLDVDEVLNRVYVANFGGYNGYGSYSVVDVDTGSSQSAPVQAPQDVVVNDVTGKAYISGAGDLISVVYRHDPTTVATTIHTGQTPKWMAVNEATNLIYVAIHDGKAVQVIDGSSDTIVATVDLGDRNPVHVAIDMAINRVYVTGFNSRGRIALIDGDTNQIIGDLSVRGDQFKAVVDQATGRLYVTSNDSLGWVTAFDPDGRKLVERQVSNRVTGIAFNPVTGRVYVSNEYADPTSERSQSVSVFDSDLNEQGMIRFADLIVGPALGVDEFRSRIYAANTYSAVIGQKTMVVIHDDNPNHASEPASDESDLSDLIEGTGPAPWDGGEGEMGSDQTGQEPAEDGQT